jgi:hypothetical protein
MGKNDFIKLLAIIIQLAIKHAPDIIDSIKEFIDNLRKSDWTEESIRALVKDLKDPEDY